MKKLEIQCGGKTCFDTEARRMCDYVRTSHFGSVFTCAIFDSALNESDPINLEKSMLLRCPRCLELVK